MSRHIIDGQIVPLDDPSERHAQLVADYIEEGERVTAELIRVYGITRQRIFAILKTEPAQRKLYELRERAAEKLIGRSVAAANVTLDLLLEILQRDRDDLRAIDVASIFGTIADKVIRMQLLSVKMREVDEVAGNRSSYGELGNLTPEVIRKMRDSLLQKIGEKEQRILGEERERRKADATSQD